ncbi:MAG: Uncharacterised protein [Marine Group II euryarchaeote MED-G33]|nr:MAG: Uncharacterised protein [Marine Group II euryarchaeote MED-G33]
MHVDYKAGIRRIGSMEFIVVINDHMRIPTITSFAIFDSGGCPRRAIVDTVCERISIATRMNDVHMTIRINYNRIFMSCFVPVICRRFRPLMIGAVVRYICVSKGRETAPCNGDFFSAGDPTAT